MPHANLAAPLPPSRPGYAPNQRRGALRRLTSAAIATPARQTVIVRGWSGLTPEQGQGTIHQLPFHDYRGFTYQGEEPNPVTTNGAVGAEAAAYMAHREIVGPASVEHATYTARIANTVFGNLASEQVVIPPSRDGYADPVVIAASPSYLSPPAKRPRTYSPARQRQLVYGGAHNPYAMQVRAPTLEDVRQFMNAGVQPATRGPLAAVGG